jgi:hypothetical protein
MLLPLPYTTAIVSQSGPLDKCFTWRCHGIANGKGSWKMDRVGIESLGTVGLPPVAFVNLAAIRHVGRKDFRLLVDTMHLGRTGGRAADIATLDPDIIGYVQLRDVSLQPTYRDYMDEALYERKVPGTGELPLLDFVAALPRDLVLGIKVPLRSEAMHIA